ncbi:hypothetical protein D3C72_1650390 [compost metagenome]
MAVAGHHHVHVGFAAGVFLVVEIQQRHAVDDADRNRRHVLAQRVFAELAGGQQAVDGIGQRDVGTGDAGGAGTAVGLDHVAIDLDLTLAELGQVHHRAQAAPDQALDFLGAAGLLATGRLAAHAAVGRARQHAVFGGDPALALALQEAGHGFVNAGGADHLGVAEFDQYRSFGVAGVIAGNADAAQRVGKSLG